jgi:hypothetical protein
MISLRGAAKGLLASRGGSWNLTSGSCCVPVWLIHLHTTAAQAVDRNEHQRECGGSVARA